MLAMIEDVYAHREWIVQLGPGDAGYKRHSTNNLKRVARRFRSGG